MAQPVHIVTGASAGIGQACAEHLAATGARVVVNYARREAEAEAVARRCRELGGDAITVQADVAVDADCRRLAQAALDQWGRIDGLVNNAGTTRFARHDDLEALQADDFHAIFDVNVIGPYQMVRAVVPSMKAQGP